MANATESDAPDCFTARHFLTAALQARKVHTSSVPALGRDCDLGQAWEACLSADGTCVILTAWSVDYGRVNWEDDVDGCDLSPAEAMELAQRLDDGEGENPVDVMRIVGQMRKAVAA